jgi:hypothetical protein
LPPLLRMSPSAAIISCACPMTRWASSMNACVFLISSYVSLIKFSVKVVLQAG